MAESFDAYRKWLAIPPEEQPPNHYRLLAVPLFESDPDVIANAADGRMAQVKNYQAGKHSQLSQKILNEIAAAKVCLLNVEKKAAYDRRLREQIGARANSPAGVSGHSSPEPEMPDFGYLAVPSGFSARTTRSVKKKSYPWQIPAVIAGVVVVLGVAVVYSLSSSSHDGPAVAKSHDSARTKVESPSQKSPAPEEQGESPVGKPSPKQSPVKEPESIAHKPTPQAKEPPPPGTPPADKPEPAATAPDKSESVAPSEPNPEPDPQPKKPAVEAKKPDVVAETPATESKKPSVPPEEKQRATERQVRDVFRTEFASAKSAGGRLALAAKLMEQAAKSDDDPAARFVLWRLASQEVAAAMELPKALEIVDKIEGQYDVNGAKMKVELLATVAEQMRTGAVQADQARRVFDMAIKLADAALANDDFEAAAHCAKLAGFAAYKGKDVQGTREVTARNREIDRLKSRHASVQKAIETLQSDPADGDANLTAGQWHCFVKGNWDKGLPLLAKGSRAELADLAKHDLARPSDTKEQIALADAWWARSEKESATVGPALQERATYWYKQAAPNVTALEKTRIERRLEGTGPADPTNSSKPSGKEPAVSVLQLPWTAKYAVEGKTYDAVPDNLAIPNGFKLPPPAIPGATVNHFVFLHSTGQFEINLSQSVRSGKTPKRFRAFCYLVPTSREGGSDGIIWTVEVGQKNSVKTVLTTPQKQDMNPIDLPIPPGTTKIVIRSLPGASNSETHDWGVMANPVIVYGRGSR